MLFIFANSKIDVTKVILNVVLVVDVHDVRNWLLLLMSTIRGRGVSISLFAGSVAAKHHSVVGLGAVDALRA